VTKVTVSEGPRIHRGDATWATLEPWLLKQAESCHSVLASPGSDNEKTAECRGRLALVREILALAQYALAVTLKDKK
jgi:hypothetical protein